MQACTCREYGVSRKTGYKWLGRYIVEGAAGLAERSHAPLQHGQAHDVAVVQAVLGLRQRWPHWGPKKLRVKLVELPSRAAGAGGQHDRRLAAARRCGWPVAPAAALSALHAAVCGSARGQRRVVHRFQEPAPGSNRGLVPDRRWPAVRPVHLDRRAQPLPAALSGGGATGRGRRTDQRPQFAPRQVVRQATKP